MLTLWHMLSWDTEAEDGFSICMQFFIPSHRGGWSPIWGWNTTGSEFSAELWPSCAVPVVEVVARATALYVHKSLSEVHQSVNQTYTVAAAWKRDLFVLVNSSPTAHSGLCSVTVPTAAVSCCTHTLKWWLPSCVSPLKCLCACP